ncbi:hypothetical protein PCASD_10214 [Puccinia coronata f. sp. avenae]|uniref:Uncharacterized protein n=1 Tax=Puccinia coronata f. sp. avenae TaxID=200324 RepID=A0A2N5UD10_9BASI|nr:hypothetical protein PCASD_10214 [Puccinia coronata f. sp. avenae]
MVRIGFSTIIFGVFSSDLVLGLHLVSRDVRDEATTGTTHKLFKRDIPLMGSFPALGGPEVAGKVFTTTRSRVTQSDNVIPTAERRVLTFIDNPQDKTGGNPEKGGVTATSLKVRPIIVTKVVTDRSLVATGPESTESSETPLPDISLDDTSDKDDSPTSAQSDKDSMSSAHNVISTPNEESPQMEKRGLVRRSFFERKLLEKDGVTIPTAYNKPSESFTPERSSTYLRFQTAEPQRNLGEFPLLGGLKGTTSAQGADKSTQIVKMSNYGQTAAVYLNPSDPQASGKFVLQNVE